MVYLLDTCTVSDFVKGDLNTLKKLKSKAPYQIRISAITAYELQYGLKKNPRLKAATKNAVQGFLTDVETIAFDRSESEYASSIRKDLETKGQTIGAYDILIAATAMSHSLILVTSSEKEFTRVADLKIENWRED